MEAPIKSPAGKVVLIVVAYHADDTGRAWPAIETIAAEASIGRRTVFRAIDELEVRGWIATYRRRGRSTIYWPKAALRRALSRLLEDAAEPARRSAPSAVIEVGQGVSQWHRGGARAAPISTKEEPIKILYRRK